MTVVRALSVYRRRLAAAVVASAITAGLAGADLVSSAGSAEAHAVPAALTAAAASGVVPAVVPVSVPDDVPFVIDVVPVTVTVDPPAPAAKGVRDVAAATLAEVPASGGVTLRFDDPRLGRHLGGVFMNAPGAILIGASRLAGDTAKTADVVRHEIAHVYQARLMTTLGYDAVDDRMDQLFGANGLERAADCVALALGATWTHYTTDCAAPERVAAVHTLVGGRMP